MSEKASRKQRGFTINLQRDPTYLVTNTFDQRKCLFGGEGRLTSEKEDAIPVTDLIPAMAVSPSPDPSAHAAIPLNPS